MKEELKSANEDLESLRTLFDKRQKDFENVRLELKKSQEQISTLESDLQKANSELSSLRYENLIGQFSSQSNSVSQPEEVSGDDNSIFEQFIIDRFALSRHRCFTRIDSESSSMEPEIVIQLSAYSQIKTFAVAIDYKSKWEDYSLNWDYLKAYRAYNKKIDGAFFVILGVGGKPDNPRAVYIIPLSLFKKDRSFTKDDLKDYCYRNPKGNLRYDITEDDLSFDD